MVPPSLDEGLSQLEESLASSKSWPDVLAGFYSIPQRAALAECCLLWNPDEVVAVVASPFKDRHGRPSVLSVATVASRSALVSTASLAPTMGRCANLARRLARHYAEVFNGIPDYVASQLASGEFLPQREFDLSDEAEDQSQDWCAIFTAVAKWDGIRGIATTRLLPLGANVALATQHEVDILLRGDLPVDGFIDVRTGAVRPVGEVLVPIPVEEEVEAEPEAEAPSKPEEDLGRLRSLLLRIAEGVETLVAQGRQQLDTAKPDQTRRTQRPRDKNKRKAKKSAGRRTGKG